MPQKSLRKVCSFIIAVVYFFSLLPSGYAFQAILLPDKILDSICVGGFDFNLNAAYAFRSAIVSQSNVASVGAFTPASININATNQALIRNQGNSAIASQFNISTIYASVGDISNAIIKNMNLADVGNVFTEAGGAKVSTLAASVSNEPLASTNSTSAATDAVNSQVSSLSAHDIVANASAAVAQTNIAAVVASNGNINNVVIRNTNVANVENQGNAAAAAQTNIAIILAGGTIGNSDVVNSNLANVVNTETTNAGGAAVTTIATTQTLGNAIVKEVITQNGAQAAQVNITFIKSMINDIKASVGQQLTQNKFISLF